MNRTNSIVTCLMWLNCSVALAGLQPLNEDEMARIEGAGVAMIMENVKLDAPSGSTAQGSLGQPWNDDCTTGSGNYSNCVTANYTPTANDSTGRGWSWEVVMVDEPGTADVPLQIYDTDGTTLIDNTPGVSKMRVANNEIGDLDDTYSAANYTRIGNSMWDDPLQFSITNNALMITLPGNLDYGLAGNLLGEDRLPSYGNKGKPTYGFIAPDADVGGSCANKPQLAKGQCLGLYTFENRATAYGGTYQLPHLKDHTDSGGNPDFAFYGSGNALLATYSTSQLAPLENVDMQFELYAQAPARKGMRLGNHPMADDAAPGNIDNGAPNVAGFYQNSQGAWICCKSTATSGVDRVAAVRIRGIHSGRTNNPSFSNPSGLNVVMLKPGGYAKAIYLPTHHCFGDDYANLRLQSNLVANCGANPPAGFSKQFVGKKISYDLGTDLDADGVTDTNGFVNTAPAPFDGSVYSLSGESAAPPYDAPVEGRAAYESWVENGDNADIHTASRFMDDGNGGDNKITQQDVLDGKGCTAPGPGCQPFNAYPEGHADYARIGGDGDSSNDKPDLRGGFRGAIEINYLRIDDIRLSRSKPFDSSSAWAGGSPGLDNASWVSQNIKANNAGVKDRELWITDVEIRDLRLGTLMTEGEYMSEYLNNKRLYNPYGLPYPERIVNSNNEVAPLSFTFFNDPYHGRTLEMFIPYHNAKVAGNGEGRVSLYTPFIAPTPNGESQCCGAVIVEGIQIDFLDARLFLDPQPTRSY